MNFELQLSNHSSCPAFLINLGVNNQIAVAFFERIANSFLEFRIATKEKWRRNSEKPRRRFTNDILLFVRAINVNILHIDVVVGYHRQFSNLPIYAPA